MNGGVQPPPAPLGLIWPGADYDSPGHLATIIMQQINLDTVMGLGNGRNMYQQIKERHPPLITKLVGKWWVNPKPGN